PPRRRGRGLRRPRARLPFAGHHPRPRGRAPSAVLNSVGKPPCQTEGSDGPLETSLHRALKERYGPGSGSGGRSEVSLRGYRVDAVAADGALVEVQSGPLGPLRGKLGRLLPSGRVRVIKPVVVSRRVIRRARPDGADLSARLSPKKGALVDVFDDLIGLARGFPHPNLRIEGLAVAIDEVRGARRPRPRYAGARRPPPQAVGC